MDLSEVGHWGVPEHPVALRESARRFLRQRLGVPAPRPRLPLDQVRLPDSRLRGSELAALSAVTRIETDRRARLGCAIGSSLLDYLAVREGRVPAPDAVARPTSHEEVLSLLRACSDLGIAVVPFGGGTSVVGGVTPLDGGRSAVVSVSLDGMAQLLSVDGESMTATVQPGITGPVLERLLDTRGLMWGHLPQSWERATIGGYLATRSAGQASSGYGRSDELAEDVLVATPVGELRVGRAPSSAAGPDLRQLVLGSEGALGIITEATLRVRRQPRYRRYEALMFPDFASGAAAFRALAQADLNATVMRLSDDDETETTLALSGPAGPALAALRGYLRLRGIGGGALAIMGWEGVSPRATAARRSAAHVAMRAHGAVPLGSAAGEAWRRHRFDGPYLRDVLLDAGYIVETLETATHWSGLAALHRAVGDALRAALESPIVFCHISHVYPTGASLYFTAVAAAQEDRAAQWRRAKQAASDAVIEHGGTITHHHAVGTDHLPWLGRELGEQGVALLRAAKRALDPAGILNPGKLVP